MNSIKNFFIGLYKNFWIITTVFFFLTTAAGAVAWRIESYGRQMDAKVIRLETEKAVREEISNAKATSTPETTLTPSQPQKAPVSLGK